MEDYMGQMDPNGLYSLKEWAQQVAAMGHQRQLAAMTIQVANTGRQAGKKGPPTMNQLNRINELLDYDAIIPHLDELDKQWDGLLRTQGGAGLIIGWMKKWISE